MVRHPNSLNEPTLFAVEITPQRSLGPKGLSILMGFVGAVGLAVSIPFYLLGAWPVVGFMGLDVLLIYAAFRYHNATARAYEQVFLTRIELLFRSIGWRGQVREARLNPRWVRIEREEHPEFGLEKLELVEGRQRIEIASALGREERAEFATARQQALAQSRR